jgi:hypothetical protein
MKQLYTHKLPADLTVELFLYLPDVILKKVTDPADNIFPQIGDAYWKIINRKKYGNVITYRDMYFMETKCGISPQYRDMDLIVTPFLSIFYNRTATATFIASSYFGPDHYIGDHAEQVLRMLTQFGTMELIDQTFDREGRTFNDTTSAVALKFISYAIHYERIDILNKYFEEYLITYNNIYAIEDIFVTLADYNQLYLIQILMWPILKHTKPGMTYNLSTRQSILNYILRNTCTTNSALLQCLIAYGADKRVCCRNANRNFQQACQKLHIW